MKRSNFPGNKQRRLASAIARLEARLQKKDSELVSGSKFLFGISKTGEIATSDVQEYRGRMQAHLDHLKTLVK